MIQKGLKLVKKRILVWDNITSAYNESFDYYNIEAWGKNPVGIKIEDKRLYDSNGTPYKGYYTKEFEATTHILNDVQNATQLDQDKLPQVLKDQQ